MRQAASRSTASSRKPAAASGGGSGARRAVQSPMERRVRLEIAQLHQKIVNSKVFSCNYQARIKHRVVA